MSNVNVPTATDDTTQNMEDMTDTEMIREILGTMRSVATGLNEATVKLQSHPLLKNFLK